MLIGTQCDYMLPSRCQCPNAATADSAFCKLHVTTTEQAPAAVEANPESKE